MKHSNELQAILTAIFCINQTNGCKDADITKICDYAFRRILEANTNLLTLICIQRSKEEIMPELIKILDEDTQYTKYLEENKK